MKHMDGQTQYLRDALIILILRKEHMNSIYSQSNSSSHFKMCQRAGTPLYVVTDIIVDWFSFSVKNAVT